MLRGIVASSLKFQFLVITLAAVVILGGLVTSTLLDLFILPTLYLRFGASREPELDLRPVTVAA
jgi:hypothetical protein